MFQPFPGRLAIRHKLYLESNTAQCLRKDVGKVLVIFDDQSQFFHRVLRFSASISWVTRGSVTVKVLPRSTLLFTLISPFIKLTSCLTMDNPRPKPPWAR